MHNKYSLGFCFSTDGNFVALIHKTHPEWQKGRINAIGGSLDGDESFIECVSREFKEEAGVLIPKWRLFSEIEGEWGVMQCFKAFDNRVFQTYSATEEQVQVYPVDEIPWDFTLPHLNWLIPLALNDGDVSVCAKERRLV